MRRSQASNTALIAIFFAIMIIINILTQIIFTVWPFPIKPTLVHVPVIVASIVLGPRIGAILGFGMGLISMITSTILTTPTSFIFSPFQPVPGTDHGDIRALFIAFIPRILIGIVPYFVYKYIKGKIGLTLAGLAGSMTNTILVLTSMYLFFGSTLNWSLKTVLATIVGTNSIAEAVLSAILTAAIVPPLLKIRD